MKTFKFEFVKLSLIWRCTNGPGPTTKPKTIPFFSSEWEEWFVLVCWGQPAGSEIWKVEWNENFSMELPLLMGCGVVCCFSLWWVMGGGTANGSAAKREQTNKQHFIQSMKTKKGSAVGFGGSQLTEEVDGAKGKPTNATPSESAVSEINQFHFSSPAARDEEMELNDWRVLAGGRLSSTTNHKSIISLDVEREMKWFVGVVCWKMNEMNYYNSKLII